MKILQILFCLLLPAVQLFSQEEDNLIKKKFLQEKQKNPLKYFNYHIPGIFGRLQTPIDNMPMLKPDPKIKYNMPLWKPDSTIHYNMPLIKLDSSRKK